MSTEYLWEHLVFKGPLIADLGSVSVPLRIAAVSLPLAPESNSYDLAGNGFYSIFKRNCSLRPMLSRREREPLLSISSVEYSQSGQKLNVAHFASEKKAKGRAKKDDAFNYKASVYIERNVRIFDCCVVINDINFVVKTRLFINFPEIAAIFISSHYFPAHRTQLMQIKFE